MKSNTFLKCAIIIILTVLIGIGVGNLLSRADSICNLLGILLAVFWIWLSLVTDGFCHLPFKRNRK